MKVRRTLVSVLIALTAAVIAIVGAAAILGCAKDKLGTPQDVVVDDYEILRWSKVEGAEKYAVKINDVYYEAQSNELDIFELTDKVGSYTIEVMAFADGKEQSQPSEKVVVEVPSWSGKLAVAELNDGSGYLVEGRIALAEGKVVVPSEVDGKHIVGFTEYGFKNCTKITSIIIPDTITSYGDIMHDPFKNCTNLRRVKFSRGATTVSGFEGCEMLKEVTFPDEVVSVTGIFKNCKNLTKVTFGKNFQNIAKGALRNNDKLKEIVIVEGNPYFRIESKCIISKSRNSVYYAMSDAVIPEGVSIIDEGAFRNTKIDTLVIPRSLKRICKEAFKTSSIREISVPSGVEFVGESAFMYCRNLEKVIFEGESKIKDLEQYTFAYCNNLKTIVLPSKVQKLGQLIFVDCKELSVRIPASVTTIEICAFKGCNGAKIEIDENNEVYSSEGNCIIHKPTKTLVHVSDSSVIPAYITKIGQYAVTGLTLETFKVPENVVEIESDAFKNCENMKDIYLPEGLKKIGERAFNNVGFCFTSLIVPNSLEEVGASAFANCEIYTGRMPYEMDSSSVWTKTQWGEGYHHTYAGNAVVIVFGCELRYDGKYPYVYSMIQNEYVITKEREGELQQRTIKFVEEVLFIPKREGYICVGAIGINDSVNFDLYEARLLGGYEMKPIRKGMAISLDALEWLKVGKTLKISYEEIKTDING